MNIESRIPASQLEKIKCPFCSSEEAEKVRNIADIVRCKSCNAIYLRTRLKERALQTLYQAYADTGSHMDPPKDKDALAKSPLKRDNFLAELLEFCNPDGVLMDVGCGWGAFMDNARSKGFAVRGFELTKKAADYGMKNLGLDINTGQFLREEIKVASVSALSMIHTLEHLSEPRKVLEKAFTILKPGGIFSGIVPNIKSFASEKLKDKWEWIDPYHHIVHYYPEFLEKQLKITGFEIERIYTASGDFNKSVLRQVAKESFDLYSEKEIAEKIRELTDSGMGEEIRFFARKPYGEPKKNIDNTGDELIEVNINEGDDYEQIIFDAFSRMKGPGRIIINDRDNILPESALNWNGVEINKNVAKNEKNEKENIMENDMDGTGMNRLKFDENFNGGLSNEQAIGKMPDPLPQPMFLNLGCGNDIREGFVNIDLFSSDPRVVGMDIRSLGLVDNSADMILASDILEHFSHREIDSVLKEWARVLKPGGEIIVRCPSLKLQVKAYVSGAWDADIASYMIFGGQTNPGDYHCVAFDEASIRKHLEGAGFVVEQVEEQDIPQDKGFINLNMTVRAKKKAAAVSIPLPVDSINVTEEYKEETEAMESSQKTISDDFLGFDFSLGSENENNAIPEVKEPEENEGDSFPIEEIEDVPEQAITAPSERKEAPYLNIVWEGSQFIYHSLALINREICSNIIDSGQAELTIIPYENEQFLPEGNPKYQKLLDRDIRFKKDAPEEYQNLPYVWIRHQWPPKAEPPKGAKWIIMQPWEYTTLRQDFADLFKQADEVWTPSTYCRKSFVDSGLDSNKVQIVPNGIDPELFTPGGAKYELKTDKRFKFLFVGGTIFRKGVDVLLKSYLKAFTSKDDVCLVIKDMGGDSFYKGQNAKEYIQKVQKEDGAPEILYIEDYLNEYEMASLYRACDVFACSYRGEGFSLPTLEAMACGLPVIVTEGGSTDDFTDDISAWKIPAEQKLIGSKIDNVDMAGDAYLLEPDGEYLASLLKNIQANPSDVKIRGIYASMKARTQWTWSKSTIKMYSRLDALYGTEMAKNAEFLLVDKEDAFIQIGLADSALEKGNVQSALDYYKKALEYALLSEDMRSYAINKIANVYIEKNNYDKADEIISKAIETYPDNPDSKFLKALIHSGREEWAEALEILTVLFENWSALKYKSLLGYALDGLLCATADGLLSTGDADNALKLFTEALKFNNNNSYACYGAAKCFLTSDQGKDQAKEMLEWAIKLNPDFAEAKVELEKMNQL